MEKVKIFTIRHAFNAEEVLDKTINAWLSHPEQANITLVSKHLTATSAQSNLSSPEAILFVTLFYREKSVVAYLPSAEAVASIGTSGYCDGPDD